MPWYEKYIRVFYREIFLDKADDGAELGFWLCQMLSSLPLVYQARMLYILYGPEDTDGISNAIMFTLQYIHHIKTTKMTKWTLGSSWFSWVVSPYSQTWFWNRSWNEKYLSLLCVLYKNFFKGSRAMMCYNLGLISWHKMTTCPTFFGVDDEDLDGIAKALVNLHKHGDKEWSHDNLISVMEELIGEWCKRKPKAIEIPFG